MGRTRRRRGLRPYWVAAITVMLIGSACRSRLNDREIKAAAGGGTAQGSGGGNAGTGDQSATGDTTGAGATGTGTGGQAGTAGGATGGATGTGGAGATGTESAAAKCKPDNSSFEVGETGAEIKFGNVSTVGGPVPGIFKGARDGTNAFFSYINARGGVCGRKLSLIFQDDGFDASQNQAAYQNLISKVFGFVGSFSTTDDDGSAVLGQNPGVPDASFALGLKHFNLPNNFSIQPFKAHAWRFGPLTYFKNKYGLDKVGKYTIITEHVQSAQDAADGEKRAADSLGYTKVYDVLTEPTDTDFSPLVTNMKNRGTQSVFMAGDAGQMAQIAAAMKAQNFSVPLANWGANAYDPAFTKQSQGGAEGAILDMQNSMFYGEDAGANPEVKLFDDWVKRVGGKPDLFAAYGWASARLMVDALTTAGPKPTRASVMSALKNIHKFNANGLFPDADPAGKIPPTCYVIVNVKGGQFVRDPVNPSGYKCDPGGYGP